MKKSRTRTIGNVKKPKKKMGALPKLKALGGKLMGAMSKAVKRG